MTIRPAGAPPMVMSKNTCGLAMVTKAKEERVGWVLEKVGIDKVKR